MKALFVYVPGLLALLALAFPAQAQMPNLTRGQMDVTHYDVDLNWDAETGMLAGTATIDAIADDDLGDELVYHLLALNVTEVRVDGVAAEFERDDPEIIITLPEAIAAGARFATTITYSGVPQFIPDNQLRFPDYGWNPTDTGMIAPGGQGAWMPVNQYDPATIDLRITVPNPYIAVTAGSMTRTDNGDTTTFAYRMEAEAEDVSLFIDNTYVLDTITLESGFEIVTATPAELVEWAAYNYQRIEEAMALFADAFGPYPFETLTIVAVPEMNSLAQANTGLLIMGGRTSERVVVHELAHQWFGASVSAAAVGDNWLVEGAATYAEWLFTLRGAYWRGYDALDGAFPNAVEVEWRTVYAMPPPAEARDWVEDSQYFRGRFTLLALQARVGSAAFFDILRTYTARYAGESATTADFITIAEAISGEDLGTFFDLLLTSPTVPPPSVYGIG